MVAFILTRTNEDNQMLIEQVNQKKVKSSLHTIFSLPCIERIGLPWPQEWIQMQLLKRDTYDILFLTSQKAVEQFISVFDSYYREKYEQKKLHIATLHTKHRLGSVGVDALDVGKVRGSVELAYALEKILTTEPIPIHPIQIFYPTSDLAKKQPEYFMCTNILRSLGTLFSSVIYQTGAPFDLEENIQRIWFNSMEVVVFFASPSAVFNFTEKVAYILDKYKLTKQKNNLIKIICYGKSTSVAWEKYKNKLPPEYQISAENIQNYPEDLIALLR